MHINANGTYISLESGQFGPDPWAVTWAPKKCSHWSQGLLGLRGEGRGVEGSRVELAENRLILGQFYSIVFYSPFLSLNPNKPLVIADDSIPSEKN